MQPARRTARAAPARRRALPAALLAAALLSACTVHPHPVVHHHPHRAEVVVIRAGHVHSHRCGHYFHRGRWFYLRGHVHGRACGHVHFQGIWRLR